MATYNPSCSQRSSLASVLLASFLVRGGGCLFFFFRTL